MRLEPVAYASLQRLFGMIGLRVALVGMMLVALLSANAGTALAQDDYGCTSGQAVPNPENNPGLVADCETLLGLKDALRGTAPARLERGLRNVHLGRCDSYHGGWRG